MIYKPIIRNDVKTSDTNLNFDQSLKLHNPIWGIRHLSEVNKLAFMNGFVQEKVVEMPANNLCVIYRLN